MKWWNDDEECRRRIFRCSVVGSSSDLGCQHCIRTHLPLILRRISTQDLVLQNLDNGPYLSALKILLCIDLLFTFPVVFSSGRQILENSILGETNNNLLDTNGVVEIGEENELSLALSRAAITAGAVGTCFGLSQLGGFGTVANLVGGLAQGTLLQ